MKKGDVEDDLEAWSNIGLELAKAHGKHDEYLSRL
jgi:hypothetical protein